MGKRADRRIALIGGSFNPIHLGHLFVALSVRTTQSVDQVWFVPSYVHPFAKPLAPFADRIAMCRAAARDCGSWLKVSEAEADVGKGGRTFELLEWLRKRHTRTDFLWIMGSDVARDLPKWVGWKRVQDLAEVVILARQDYRMRGAVGPALPAVSSTAIRAALRVGEIPCDVLPTPVVTYILRHHLYGYRPKAG